MDEFGIAFLGHNIPPVLALDVDTILACRVENTRDHDVHVHSPASFYGASVSQKTCRLFLRLDGAFLKSIPVYKDCLRRKERATLHVPFRPKDEGRHRLEIVIAEEDAASESPDGQVLVAADVEVRKAAPTGLDLGRVKRALFSLLYTELPLRWKRVQFRYQTIRLERGSAGPTATGRPFHAYKEANRELAFLEQQTRQVTVASLPCYVTLDTTSKCNLRCRICFRRHSRVDYDAAPDMAPDTINQLIRELFPTALTVNFSSIGEPLISAQTERLLQACVDYGIYLSLTTNGTLLQRDDLVRKLVAVVHHIEISFDSVNPARFESLRTGASYQRVLAGAAKLGAIRRGRLDPKFNLGFSMTLFRENLEEVPEMLRLVSEIGGNFLKADIGMIFSKRDIPQSVVSCPELYNEVYQAAHEKARESGIRLLMRSPFHQGSGTERRRSGICDYLYQSAVVRADATLGPCYAELTPSATVRGDFRKGWNGEFMQRLRREHDADQAHPFCRDCYVVLTGAESVENRRRQFWKGDASG